MTNFTHAIHALALGATLALGIPSASAAGSAFTYQGQLKDAGVPANGTYDIEFRLYSAASGGAIIAGPETINDVNVSDGLFTAMVDFGLSAFTGADRWLAITVDGETLSPRQPLSATPYAMFALNAPFLTNGSSVYYNGGNVGIGTSDPGEKLEVAGSVLADALRLDALGSAGAPAITFDSDDNTGIFSTGNNAMSVTTGGTERARISGPALKLFDTSEDTWGAHFDLNEVGNDNWQIIRTTSEFASGSQLRFRYDDGGGHSTRMTIDPDGDVGIGTSTPEARLHIRDAEAPLLVETTVSGAAAGEFHSAFGNAVVANAESHTAVHAYGFGGGVVAESPNIPLRATAIGATPLNIALFTSNITGTEARIDINGRGYFNGGTQTGGADLAEAFAVEGDRSSYEPGDVLVISTDTDRTVRMSANPYSTLVSGVVATKPGVLLTERLCDEPMDDLVPMGVVGVIPTKVSLENGPIQRGDLLVTSSLTGHAMKGTDRSRLIGAILGKALENFDGSEGDTGVIKVMVNVK